jgi:deoxyribonuclease V
MSYRPAVAMQQKLRGRVSLKSAVGRVRFVAGVDASYEARADMIYAGVVVVDLRDMSVVERRGAIRKSRFPYIPGLLSFREAPAILAAMKKLTVEPDCVLVDGQGLAHPRRFGIACHLGVILDVPTVGCAKSILVGEHEPVGDARGAWAALRYEGRVVGRAVRTRGGVKPVYVSPGNKVSFARAMEIVLKCGGKYRLPEPARLAHQYVNEMRRAGRQTPKRSPDSSGLREGV